MSSDAPWDEYVVTPENDPAPQLPGGVVVPARTMGATMADEAVVEPWMEFMKAPTPGRSGSAIKNRVDRAKRKYEAYLADVKANRGEAALARVKEVEDMPFLKKAMISAGRETDKLLAGGAEFGDFLGDTIGLDGMHKRTQDRANEQAELDQLYTEFSENAGAGHLGAVLPYGVSGVAAGPAAARGMGGAMNLAGRSASAAGRSAEGLLTRGMKAATKLPGHRGKLARRFKRETFDPKAQWLKNKSMRPNIPDPGREGIMKTLLGDTALGAVEGGLHFDQNPVEGAIASLAGSSQGMFLRPAVSKAPDVRNQQEKDLVAWGESQGGRYMPGMKTGSQRHQTFEAGLRNDSRYMNTIAGYDKANDAAMNRAAYTSMGIIDDTKIPKNAKDRADYFAQQDEMIKGVTPEQLNGHLKNMSDTYKELESTTKGKLQSRKILDFKHEANRLKNSKSPMDRAAGREMDAVVQKMVDAYSPYKMKTNRRGGSRISEYDGSKYQSMRSDITAKMDGAYDTNKVMYKKLKEMRDELDESIKRGMGEGSDKLKAWKNANEKYAMTQIVMQNGMTQGGKLDLDKLGAHFLNTDNRRFLTESGGDRITNLHKMSKLRDMENRQRGNTLTSDSIPQPKASLNPWQSFLASPISKYTLPIVPKAYVGAYAKGYPSRFGLLGMNNTLGEHLWELPGMTRALAQANQIHPWLAGQAQEGGATLMDAGKAVGEGLFDAKDWMMDAWNPDEEK